MVRFADEVSQADLLVRRTELETAQTSFSVDIFPRLHEFSVSVVRNKRDFATDVAHDSPIGLSNYCVISTHLDLSLLL